MSFPFEYRIRSLQLEAETCELRVQMLEDRDRQIEDFLSKLSASTQKGINTVTTDVNGVFTITFPVAFPDGTLPVISIQLEEQDATNGYCVMLIGSALSSTAFSARIWHTNSQPAGAAQFEVHWKAD